MTIVEKNHHLEAATALLRSRGRAKGLIASLEQRSAGSYRFVANNSTNINVAVLAVLNPGATVTILSTEPTNDREIKQISHLIQSTIDGLLDTNTAIAQSVFPEGHQRLEETFAGAGFHHLATLNYMERSLSHPKQSQTCPDHVRISTMLDNTDDSLGALMEETYQGSLDCPKIQGLRQIQDIIKGHRGHGHYDAQLWFIAEVESKPAGVLLLNPIPDMQCMELAYLGVTPTARQHGLGNILLQHAITQTIKFEMTRITLAVDAQNMPAISLYERWEFKKTRARCTMIRKLY